MKGLDSLYLLLTQLKREYRLVSKELSRCPEGELMIFHNHGYTKYAHVTKAQGIKHRHEIGKTPRLINRLAHKRFLEEKKQRLEDNIRIIEAASKQSKSMDTEEILAEMPKYFDTLDTEILINGRKSKLDWPHPSRDKDICPQKATLSTESLTPEEWGALPYCENTSYLDRKNQLAARGFICRSKSEAAIIGIYDSLRIPYHYDESMYFGNVLLSPDFVGARSDRALIYHEHFGLSDSDYRRNSLYKLNIYGSAGIMQGINLICTFEDEEGSINLELIEAQIRDIYGI